MKNLFLLILIIPTISFAQKFDFSEQGGYSILKSTTPQHGFSNQVRFGYHPFKHFSVSALYEYNAWTSVDNSYGLAQDFVSKYFYTGIDEKMDVREDRKIGVETINYKPSLSYGIHAGLKQKICKRLNIIEQVGYDILDLKETISYKYVPPPPPPAGTLWTDGYGPIKPFSLSTMQKYYYLRIGISYKF